MRPAKYQFAGLTCWLLVENQSAPPFGIWLTTFTPNYLYAGLAVASGVLVHGLKEEVVDAHRRIMELGSYQLIRKLGEGGMWRQDQARTWWRRHHRKSTGRRRARVAQP